MKKIVLLLIVCLLGSVQLAEAQLIRSSQTVITKTKKEKVKKEKVKKEKVKKEKVKKVLDPVEAGLQQEISIEVGGLGVKKVKQSIGANYTIGYRFNNTLFIGGGLGLGYNLCNLDVWDVNTIYAQFFGDIRAYLTKTRVQPYFDLSLGGHYITILGVNYYLILDKEFGMFANPQFGINWRLNNRCSLNLAVGYKWISSPGDYYDFGNKEPRGSLRGYPQVKIGFSF